MQKWWQTFLPDRGAWFFLYLLFGMLFIRPEMLLWDGGSCRHIINGVFILNHHTLPTTNYTSALFQDSPCLTRCWLGDLITGIFYQSFHLNGVVLICSLAIVLGLTWSYQMGRERGLGLVSGLLALLVVIPTAGMHWSARCHVYTYLPFLALYYVLFIRPRANWLQPLIVASLMCIWVNLHGSYMIGMGLIAVKLACDAWEYCRKSSAAGSSSTMESPDPSQQPAASLGAVSAGKLLALDAGCILASLLATCINPRGIEFYSHVAGYLSNPLILRMTDEWKPFDLFTGLGCWTYLLMVALAAWLIWASRKLPPLSETIILIGLCIAGFSVMRLIPYSVLMMMPALGPSWLALKNRIAADDAENKEAGLLTKLVRLELKGEGGEKSSLRLALGSLLLAAAMGSCFVLLPWCAITDFDPERMPVRSVDYMQKNDIQGLGFNYDNWGGYIYFRLNHPVFIDDWADFLPIQFVKDYLDILTAKNDWKKHFDAYDFRWVLAPKEAQLSQILSKSPEWQKACQDDASVLFIKPPASKSRQP